MYRLTNEGIAQACESVNGFLTMNKVERAESIRLRMMLEEVLLNYQAHFGDGETFSIRNKKVLGRLQVIVSLRGESFDPFADEEDGDLALLRKLNADSASTCVWAYRNGVNTVSFAPRQERKLSSSAKTIVAIALAVLIGLISARLPDTVREPLLEGFVSPTLSTIMGVISAVAGPMIFFSLLWGVCTIGDMETLSKIGKRMLGRFMLELLAASVVTTLICYPFFRSGSQSVTSFRVSEFYELLLGIVPNNSLSPIISGNTQQIIFLAIVGGVVLLLLGERASAVSSFVNHMNVVVQTIMSLTNKLIPFMVFLSILKIALNGQLSILSQAYKLILIFLGLSLAGILLFGGYVLFTQKVKASVLIKKTLQVFLLGLTTASSSAALSQNLQTCREDLGIDKKIVSFGVPLGQTLFKPVGMVRFITIGFCMAELYEVPISSNWLAVMILTGFLLAISAPPVAGGAAVCFAILFEQLGIPAEAIGFALAINVLFDFVLTAGNLFCLQMNLIGLSGSLNMLDRDALRAEKKTA